MQDRTLNFLTSRKSDFLPCDFIHREIVYAHTSLYDISISILNTSILICRVCIIFEKSTECRIDENYN